MPSAPPPPSGRRFLTVFAAVAMSFIASTLYTQHVQLAIDRAAQDIGRNAAPSMEHLLAARLDLRQIQMLVNQEVTGGISRERVEAVARAYADFKEEIAAYLRLPVSPGERELWATVARDVERVDSTLPRFLASGESSPTLEVAAELSIAAALADESISRSAKLAASHTRELAQTIEQIRIRSKLIQEALDGASAVLALIMGVVLLWTVRSYTTLVEFHGHLLERRADELERFSGRVAHDILSPLQSTSLALDIAGKALPPDSRAAQAVARGLRSLTQVQRTVDGLLEFARAGARPAADARTELGPILTDVVGELEAAAQARKIEVKIDPFAPCAVACSPGILTSLLANLLQNAIKYLGDREERRVRVRVCARPEAIRVEVADTGPGIPAEILDQIFEPYVRALGTREPGIGLGLATVKRIAETHGGQVGVRSRPGQGSTFWFELPAAKGEAFQPR